MIAQWPEQCPTCKGHVSLTKEMSDGAIEATCPNDKCRTTFRVSRPKKAANFKAYNPETGLGEKF